MTRVITIGSATQDVILHYPTSAPLWTGKPSTDHTTVIAPEGAKIDIDKISYHLGGGALNSATSFSRLDCQTSSFFKIGNDQAGNFLLDHLKKTSVALHPTIGPTPTGISFIVPTPNHDRIVFAYRGANNSISYQEIPLSVCCEQDLLYITALSGASATTLPSLTKAVKNASTRKIKISVNPGTHQLATKPEYLKSALHDIDTLILNREEMELFMTTLKPKSFRTKRSALKTTGPSLIREIHTTGSIAFTLIDYLEELFNYGVKRAVITNGKEGVYCAVPGTLYFHTALPTQVINALGAGDAFGSTFSCFLAQGYPLQEALKAGLLNAQSVIMQINATDGLLKQKILLEKMTALKNWTVEIYPFTF